MSINKPTEALLRRLEDLSTELDDNEHGKQVNALGNNTMSFNTPTKSITILFIRNGMYLAVRLCTLKS